MVRVLLPLALLIVVPLVFISRALLLGAVLALAAAKFFMGSIQSNEP